MRRARRARRRQIFDSGIPAGICYGRWDHGGPARRDGEGGHHREFGRADVEVKAESQLFDSPGAWGERIRSG